MWLLAAADLVDPYPRYITNLLVEVFVASLIAAFVVGALAMPAPMLVSQLITVLLPKILGRSVEQPLVRAVQHPLMRLLTLVFIGVWLVKFGFSGYSLKEGLLTATWSAALAVLMVLGAVVLWRLATRDKP